MSISGLMAYIQFCIEEGVSAPVCRDLWTWTFVAFITIMTLVVAVMAWMPIRRALRVRAALRAQDARDAVDFDAIEALRWKGDDEPAIKDAPPGR